MLTFARQAWLPTQPNYREAERTTPAKETSRVPAAANSRRRLTQLRRPAFRSPRAQPGGPAAMSLLRVWRTTCCGFTGASKAASATHL